MNQKLVSFEVARAIKEKGYPQGHTARCYDKNGVLCDWYKADALFDAPIITDVWLWLWREKKLYIQTDLCFWQDETSFISIDRINNIALVHSASNDPEEAIASAIEYLVEYHLIK